MVELPSGTVTFFFSDIEQSTKLASRLGDAFVKVLGRHREIVRAAFTEWRGMEVSTGGDSFFAVFPAASDAIQAAAAIQRASAADARDGDAVNVRIGLHTGQAVRVGHDYVGLDVHLAARVADAGHGGQVLVSESTRAALAGDPPGGLGLIDLGRHRLKDVGPQRLWQLAGPELPPGPFPPLRSLEAHPTNLPVAAGSIVGRERELGELAGMLHNVSILTITGPGGIGKSRLAIEVARALLPSFPDGVFHLELAAIPDAFAAAGALIETLQLRSSGPDDAVAMLLDGLRSRDLLLVLETADRVSELPELVARIAGACPRIRLLVTSRSPLHVKAEREYAVAPLSQESAVQLFVERASAVNPRLTMDAATRPAVERLVDRLDGIPLAIELAAARSRVFSPAVLLDRLERQLPALGEASVDAPDRQRTLQGTIAWSCDLLPPDEQTLFRELAVFPDSFSVEAAEAIATPPSSGDTVVLLEALVDRSLVLAGVGRSGEPRFRLLGPIREFALAGLRASQAEDDVRVRFAVYWASFARQVAAALDQHAGDALETMHAEEANLRAALQWATTAGAPELDSTRRSIALQLAGSVGRSWWLRGRVHEGLDWLERSLAGRGDGPPDADVARVLYWHGVLLDDARRHDDARHSLEEALAIYRELGDEAAIARMLNSLGVVARSVGDVDRAQHLLTESIERKRRLNDRSGLATSLSNLGVLATDLGRFDEAVDYMRQALAIDEEVGTDAVPVAIANLGMALVRAGHLAEGAAELRRALPGLTQLGDPEVIADALTGVGAIILGSGDDSRGVRAARLLSAAGTIRTQAGLPLRAVERVELEALEAQLRTLLDERALAAAQSEVVAVDVEAALALLRAELAEL